MMNDDFVERLILGLLGLSTILIFACIFVVIFVVIQLIRKKL